MATLSVGANQAYSTIAAAVASAQDGDVVAVQAGTYTNDFATVTHKITLQAVGGIVNMVATVSPPNGKAILTTDTDVTVDHFTFSGAAVPDGNGAGIRYEAGNLVVKNSLFVNNQNGILGAADLNGTITIQDSEFDHNGTGDGRTHNIYIGEIAQFTVTGSYFHDAVVGHEIKSRALASTIIGNRIVDNATGSASYSIDLPNGGVNIVKDNVIEKGPASQNPAIIHLGGEGPPYDDTSLKVSGNTVINDRSSATFVLNQTGTATPKVTGNSIYGLSADQIAIGDATVSGNTMLTTSPTLDTSTLITHPASAATTTGSSGSTATSVTPISAVGTPVEYGRAGAVTASGHILTVGAGQQFATLAAAVSASVDGDTIRVNAGYYVNDFAEITHKVIIEGVGGMAKFVATAQPANGKAQLVTDTDVTIRNLEVSGTTVPDGNGAGIRSQGGNLTLVNTYFHNNQDGVLAAAVPGSTVSIYDSEFSQNGSGTGSTHGIYANEIGTLTIRNSWFHDTSVGHEIKSRADNTVLDGNRITQAAGNGSYDVDLPNGGYVVLTNNLIEKGAGASNSNTVHFGGEGPPYTGSSLTATGNTFVNDRPGAVLFLNHAGSPATFSNNSVYGFPASQLAQGTATFTGTTTLTTEPSLATNSGVQSTASAAATVAAATTPDYNLVLNISEDAYLGDAQYTISVDGTQVGGSRTATTSHLAGQSQAVALDTSALNTGVHQVAVTYFNDLYGNAAGDRNLYINSATYNGQAIAGSASNLYNNSTSAFYVAIVVQAAATATATTTPVATTMTTAATPVTPMTTPVAATGSGLVVNISEDAYLGDAQYIVSIDGVQAGGIRTATASHLAGQNQAVAIDTSTLSAGSHQVGVTFINDAYGGTAGDRNLYVGGAAYNGQAVGGSTANLYSNGTDAFNVTIAAPATTTPVATMSVAATPVTPTTTPVAATGSGLVVNISEDAYLGDAQYTISIDGTQVGGTRTATASHLAGQSQAVAIDTSTLSAGSHQVGVTFINDAYGGTAGDRNLYVGGAAYNGQAVGGSTANLYSNGTDAFNVTIAAHATTTTMPVTSTLTLNVSEDAFKGNAQFTVAVDGQAIAGIFTATASHSAGQSTAIVIPGIAEHFNPHDIAVSFINDDNDRDGDRNLYVNSVTFDGQTIAGATANLYSNGTQHFTAVAPANWTG